MVHEKSLHHSEVAIIAADEASHRLQLVMSNSSMEGFTALKDAYEASYGEIVRRSLMVMEDLSGEFEIEVEDDDAGDAGKEKLSLRVQVVLPRKTFDRLERLSKKYEGISFSQVIRAAINLFADLTKHRGKREPLMLVRKSNGKYAGLDPVFYTA